MDALTIFRVRDGIADPADILQVDKTDGYPVRLGEELLGILYVARQTPKHPKWLSYFGLASGLDHLTLRSVGVSAVFVLPCEEKIFALTFGYGRYLLREEAIQSRFGLQATLNAIEPTKIRSIDHTRLDAVSRHTREQVSKASTLLSFGLDVERDLLRAVTGTPSDDTYGERLSGADALMASGKLPLPGLRSLLRRYDELSRKEDYRQNFPWVDNIAEVSDFGTKAKLDIALVGALVDGPLEKIWLAIPEIVNWGEITGFSYRKRGEIQIHADLELTDYFSDMRSRESVRIERLKDDRVFAIGPADGDLVPSWSIYRCLVAEVGLDGRTYVLSEGKWYEIAATFMVEVDGAISSLPRSAIQLPRYADGSEAEYNARAAAGSQGELALLDKQLIECGMRAKVEPCDLYSRRRQLVHVKRYGASSVLSHLFAQGVVSAQMLLQDRTFRVRFNDKLPASHRLDDPDPAPRAGDFEVAYAIVIKPGGALQLPFFSKVNLRNSASLLRQLGYQVTLTAIESLRPST